MKKYLLSAILLFCSIVTQAQWQTDFRMTNDGAQSYMSGPHQKDIASSGNVLHVVWHDERSNWDIYYKRSTDAGATWSADIRLSNGPGESHGASVAVSGSVVLVMWYDNRDGHWELFYIRSTDNGATWGTETRFTTNDNFNSVNPVASVSGSNVHVSWGDDRNGNYEVYYKRSTDNGLTWNTDSRLTNNASVSESPSISSSGSYVHIVWYDDRDGNWEIYYKRSTDDGTSWGADTRLSDIPNISLSVTLASSGTFVHVVWQDERDNDEIYYKRSTDGGLSWGADTRMTNNSAYSAAPNITLSGSNVHLTWQDGRDGNFEVYYKRSTDSGINWGSDTRLTNAGGNSLRTFSTVTGTAVHVVWMDERDGNWEIYYKQDPTGNPTPPPPAPVLISPANNSTGNLLTVTLSWNASAGASSYRVQMALDSLFANIFLNDSTLTGTSRIVSGLSALTKYYWRVNAKNTGGASPWSLVWNFKTMGTPTLVTLLLPLNNAVNVPLSYTFRWSKAYDQTTHLTVSGYWYERVTDTVSMANILRDTTLTDTSKAVTGMSNNTSYYWRVKAKNQSGWGNFASWFKFTTTMTAPAPPNLVSPPNGSFNEPTSIRFIWNKPLYAATYRMQIAMDSLFTNMVLNDSTLTDSTIVVVNFLAYHYYWWRVNAKNTAGTSPYSTIWKFGTFPVGLINKELEIPDKYFLYDNYPNPFNPSTTIKFDIPKFSHVKIIVYDMLGREVEQLLNEEVKPGSYEVKWDGSKYASGLYFYKIITDGFSETRKMILAK